MSRKSVENKFGFGNNSMVISNSVFQKNKVTTKKKRFGVKIEHDQPPVSIDIDTNDNLMGER